MRACSVFVCLVWLCGMIFGCYPSMCVAATPPTTLPSPLRQIPQLGIVPQKIVSINQDASQILTALDKAAAVIGISLPDTPLPGLQAASIVGTDQNINIQRIIALQPDLIIARPQQYHMLAQINASPIPILWLDGTSLEEIEANIRCLGILMQAQDKAEALIVQEHHLLEIVQQKIAAVPATARPKVLPICDIINGNVVLPAPKSLYMQRLRLAGVQLPAMAKTTTESQWSGTDATRFAPQYMIIPHHLEESARQLLHTPEWKNVAAVVRVFPQHVLNNANSTYGMATLQVATSLFTEQFLNTGKHLVRDRIIKSSPLSLPFSYIESAKLYEAQLFDIPCNSLVIRFKEPQKVVSTQHGWHENIAFVGNHYSPPATWPITHTLGFAKTQDRINVLYQRGGEASLFLHTGADMHNYAYAELRHEGLVVGIIATAGVTTNALRAGIDTSTYTEPGTINIIALTNRELNPEAMLQAIVSITEAKTAALQALDIRSTYSGRSATGTGTDAVMLIAGQGPTASMAGGHTKLGELLAKATAQAVTKAIYKQNAISASRNVLHRLAERHISLLPELSATLTKQQAQDIAQQTAQLLLDPYYAGFMTTAMHLADAHAYDQRAQVRAFEQWCLSVAQRTGGTHIDNLPEFYATSIALPVRMALNALAAHKGQP